MYKKCLYFAFVFILMSNVIFANSIRPKKKKRPKYAVELDELVIQPFNPLTAYKSSYTKIFDLLHTKLEIQPNIAERKLYGKATLDVQPHFYNQTKLILDAKGMLISNVQLLAENGITNTKKLAFENKSNQLIIDLKHSYSKTDKIKIAIDYIARPYEGLDSITLNDGRGMYFIDAHDKNPYKPFHIWTQGESEAASCWFPTLEATNQKSTQEIFITVDKKYTTLSNGLLIKTIENADGTKTDYWKQDLPHAPYLFFVAIGEYEKFHTNYKNKSVDYYTFPKYAKDVAEVFKNTPEMMAYFSDKLGVEFPWDKYAQIIAYDYTAGAMENSSASIFYEPMFATHQFLLDANFDWIIVHELFHQWFGDLVTSESWANLTLNESLADYSEYLWTEYKYGKENADAYGYESQKKYLKEATQNIHPIVNHYYDIPGDMFSAHTYEKGGKVLHMLRKYLGDDAFFEALNKYLNDNRFKSAELSDFRKAFESVSGQDLQWFFNQWWLEKGHPILDITHSYDSINKKAILNIKQTQKNNVIDFKIPTQVAIYENGKKRLENIEINEHNSTFYFDAKTPPQLVNFDNEKIILCEKKENLTIEQNIFKYKNATQFLDKLESLEALKFKQKNNVDVQKLYLKAINDSTKEIRKYAIANISYTSYLNKNELSTTLQKVLTTDIESVVRKEALQQIFVNEKNICDKTMEEILQNDSSLYMKKNALDNLYYSNKNSAYNWANKLKNEEHIGLMEIVGKVLKDTALPTDMDYFKKLIWKQNSKSAFANYKHFKEYLSKQNSIFFDNGIQFLLSVNQNEESAFNITQSKNLITELTDYYSQIIKDKKAAAVEKTNANEKISILNKYEKEFKN